MIAVAYSLTMENSLIFSVIHAGAKAFEWQQEIGLNQARRSGEVAVLDNLLEFHLEEASPSGQQLLGGDGAAPAAVTQVCASLARLHALAGCSHRLHCCSLSPSGRNSRALKQEV